MFAAITAIVCLAPGLPSHRQQALGVLLGVGTGIIIGELALEGTEGSLLPRMSIATFFAIIIATSFGFPPVVPIQAGVSAALVLALGPSTAGQVRMLDVAIGAGIGLLFSQVLITPDPVRTIEDAVRGLFRKFASGFAECSLAVTEADAKQAVTALDSLSKAHDDLIVLRNEIQTARRMARWTLRGRFVARKIRERAARYDRQTIRLYAAALLFVDALAEALRKNEAPPPHALAGRIAQIERACAHLAESSGRGDYPAQFTEVTDITEPLAPSWRLCVTHLYAVEGALRALNAPGR